jgi:hypothetical protein
LVKLLSNWRRIMKRKDGEEEEEEKEEMKTRISERKKI